ncbi:MAG: glycosyltransferase family 39 protein [Ignavibacteriae bacterium]|nr:glycosyltransferase family 39 protein [Ignavibacteriota bacterium]
MRAKDKYFLLVLLIVYAIIRIAFFAKPLLQIDGYAVPDDAYLSLDIARNIALGKWFIYGAQHTSGFQPLYVFIMAPVFLFFKGDAITPLYISLVLLSLVGFATIYFLYKLIRIIYDDDYSPFISVLLFILLPVTIANVSNGLETSISFFFFTLIFYYLYKYWFQDIKPLSPKQLFLFGLLIGLSFLARVDNIMVLPGILVFTFLKSRKEKLPWKNVLYLAAGIAVLYLPYMILSYIFTGDVLPASGKAVHQIGKDMVDYHSDGQSGLFTLINLSFKNIYTNYSAVIVFAIVTTFIYRLKTQACPWLKGSVTEHWPLITTSLFLFASYTFYLTANWFYSRYFFPLSLFFVVLAAFASNQLILGFQSARSKTFVFASIVIVLLVANIVRPGFKDFFFKDYPRSGYLEVGKWVNDNFPKGTVIGSNQTGALGYFAKDMNIINLDGVVNKDAYTAVKNKEIIEYIRSQKIEYFIDWKINYEFIVRNSKNFKDGDLVLVKKIDGLKSWDYEWFLYKVNY